MSGWASFKEFLSDYRVGDLASVAGVVISLVGFGVTVLGVMRSAAAAERAEKAAKAATDSIRLFETVVDFTAAISTLEEIKRAQRSQQWALLPDRYAAIRKMLVALRASDRALTAPQLTIIQGAIANLRSIEGDVERGLARPAALKPARLNALISTDIDNLAALLAELKRDRAGV